MKKSRILCLSLCMVVLTACAYTQKGDEMESKTTENKVYETENSMQQTETFTAESKVTDVMEDTAFQGYEQFMMLGDAELNRRFSMQDEAEQKAKIDREQANELEYADESQRKENSDRQPVRNPEREKPKQEDKDKRLSGTWTLEQYEGQYRSAMYAAVKAANPNWKPGQKFDTSILDNVTRESAEATLVKNGNRLVRNSIDVSVQNTTTFSF